MSMPNQDQIDAIPLSRAGEFELTERETRTLRSRLYAINRDGIRKYRTQREAPYTMVWRIK